MALAMLDQCSEEEIMKLGTEGGKGARHARIQRKGLQTKGAT